MDKGDFIISELAEDDYERIISPEEHNQFIDAINEMIKETGQSDFLEHVTEAEVYAFYGGHAIRDIRRKLSEGTAPEDGEVMWY